MPTEKTLYLYPFTSATLREGGNRYIPDLVQHLGRHFKIVNKQTNLGLLDVVQKLPKCDVLYFNWIEDVADKKFGALQVLLLWLILKVSKSSGKKIVWFIHNNLSHKKKNLWLKRKVVSLMKNNADVVLSHSKEARVAGLKQTIQVFDHPVEGYMPLTATENYEYDLLIWGTVTPYKGVEEFLKFNFDTTSLRAYKILVAGKFASPEYFETIQKIKAPNSILENRILEEAELVQLFSKSRYVLFTYNSASVLSSAALCKTLSFGKTIIGPHVGAFKELGTKGLIYTYDSFENLASLLNNLHPKKTEKAYQKHLQEYIAQHSWPQFARFVAQAVNGKRKAMHVQAVI